MTTKTTGRTRRWLPLAGLLATMSASSTALAQAPGEELARRAFEDGVALEKKGDFATALDKFKESERIKPTLGNRFHKAYCLEMTGKLAAALIEYEALERAARDANKAEIVEQTRARLDPLRARAPQVSLTIDADGPKDAEVTLDGAPVAAALLDGKSFRVDIGEHTVKAQAAGREPFTKTFNAAEKSATAIEIALPVPAPAAPRASATTETAPPAEAGPSRPLVLPILTTAGAVVLAAGGVGAFLLAGKESDDLKATCATKPSCDDDGATTRTLDAVALGAWIGAAGLGVLSVVLWASKPSAPSAQVAVRPSWVGVEGRF